MTALAVVTLERPLPGCRGSGGNRSGFVAEGVLRTIDRWEEAGRLHRLHPVRLPTGQRRFSRLEADGVLRSRKNLAARCAVYARASSAKQLAAGNPDLQLRLRQEAAERGYEVAVATGEGTSGLNEKRKGLPVEFKDHLTRFGFADVAETLDAYGVRVDVVDGTVAVDATQESVQDDGDLLRGPTSWQPFKAVSAKGAQGGEGGERLA